MDQLTVIWPTFLFSDFKHYDTINYKAQAQAAAPVLSYRLVSNKLYLPTSYYVLVSYGNLSTFPPKSLA